MRALKRLLVCLGLAFASFILLLYLKVEVLTRIVLSWDIFGLAMIIMSWKLFLKDNCRQVRKHAQTEDESRTIIFILVLASVVISLMGILIMLNNKTKGLVLKSVHAPVSIIGVTISWILLHTIFTIRYAHVYYSDDPVKPGNFCGGIIFPEEKEPDYLDFAYFSFVIGMTFQVSDTSITLRHMRRLVLLHSMLSFGYNTVIIAISISVITNLI
jgi:uncharacterized membrane protein